MKQITILLDSNDGSKITELPFLYETQKGRKVQFEYTFSNEKKFSEGVVVDIHNDLIVIFPDERVERRISLHIKEM